MFAKKFLRKKVFVTFLSPILHQYLLQFLEDHFQLNSERLCKGMPLKVLLNLNFDLVIFRPSFFSQKLDLGTLSFIRRNIQWKGVQCQYLIRARSGFTRSLYKVGQKLLSL